MMQSQSFAPVPMAGVGFTLTEGQQALQQTAAKIARELCAPMAAATDQSEEYPQAVADALTDAGLMGMTVPKDLGGAGRSYLDVALAVEELAARCGVSGRILVEGNMGAVGAIIAYGTTEQRQMAAKHVLGGDKPAICITEPDAGSAATEMRCVARRNGAEWVLEGKKHWITGGGVSKLHLIFARVIEDGTDKGIAGFMAFLGEMGWRLAHASRRWGCAAFPRPR